MKPEIERAMRRTPSEQLLKDAHDATSDALESWMKPDRPEAVVIDMKGLMVIRDRIAARLGLFRHNDPIHGPRQ